MNPNPIRSVPVATDLTPASGDVPGSAARVARAADARLHVIHAFDLELSPYPGIGVSAPTFPGRIAEAHERLDAQLAHTLPGRMEAASREVVIYAAHRAIVERAITVRADVIVLGPHRDRSAGLPGTTADRAIRSAPCPCLVLRRLLRLPLRRVLVPIDLSEPAASALVAALGWCERPGPADGDHLPPPVQLDVVHVIPRFLNCDELPANHAAMGPRLSAQVKQALAGHGAGVDVREELLRGDGAAAEIVRYAEQRHAGLLVLATHGHGAVKRALVGSVAAAVARTAQCAVLLVPPARWSGVRAEAARGVAAGYAEKVRA